MSNTALQTAVGDNSLQLSPIQVKPEYLDEWNENSRDFVCLTRNGELVSNTLYRVGGIGTKDIKDKRYFMLLKHVEAYYSADIMKQSRKYDKNNTKSNKHLASRWCILDSNGVEKFVAADSIHSPYLVKDSCIYSVNRKYYNIETQELYCEAYTAMESAGYLFLDNQFDKDKSKRGVMKVDKATGTWELFPE